MPTRILREGIITSELVDKLSERAEVFYRRLMSVADDYGRYYANPSLLRAACYPLRIDRTSEAHVKQALSECQSAGLVTVYGAGKYLQIANFKQQTRAASKFPQPAESDLLSKCKADAKQMRSESESESESESDAKAGSESESGASAATTDPVESILAECKAGDKNPNSAAVKEWARQAGLSGEALAKHAAAIAATLRSEPDHRWSKYGGRVVEFAIKEAAKGHAVEHGGRRISQREQDMQAASRAAAESGI